jgi:hypothetical protein
LITARRRRFSVTTGETGRCLAPAFADATAIGKINRVGGLKNDKFRNSYIGLRDFATCVGGDRMCCIGLVLSVVSDSVWRCQIGNTT